MWILHSIQLQTILKSSKFICIFRSDISRVSRISGTNSSIVQNVQLPTDGSVIQFIIKSNENWKLKTIPIEIAKENKISMLNNIRLTFKLHDWPSIRDGTKGLEAVGLIANHSFSLVNTFEREVNVKKLKQVISATTVKNGRMMLKKFFLNSTLQNFL